MFHRRDMGNGNGGSRTGSPEEGIILDIRTGISTLILYLQSVLMLNDNQQIPAGMAGIIHSFPKATFPLVHSKKKCAVGRANQRKWKRGKYKHWV